MLNIDNQALELLAYAILIPLGLVWGIFVLMILLAGLIGIKSIIFPGPTRTWKDMIEEQENRLQYESIIEESTD